jgi:hypothetical protein
MHTRIVLAFAGSLLLAGECVDVREAQYGTVDFIANDLTGARIKSFEVEVFAGPGESVEAGVRSGPARLRYGTYRVRLHAPGFASRWLDLRLHQRHMTVRAELPIGSLGCAPPPAWIGGTVKRDGTGELWIKAIPVRGAGGGEALVSEPGYFLISGLEHTAYILLVMQGETVLHQQVVRTYPAGTDTSKLMIDLRGRR